MNPIFVMLALYGLDKELKDQFINLILRLGFYQNFERDYPGTKKSLFPQYYAKGERYDDGTIMDRGRWVWRPDFADIAMPNDWNIFLRGFRLRGLYPLILFCDLFLLAMAWIRVKQCKNDPTECDDMQILNQFILAKAILPTPVARYAIKYYFQNRPMLEGSKEVTGPMSAVERYFTKGYDNPEWIRLWRPICEWLCRP